MTRGCSKLRPRDCPRKHAERDILVAGRARCSTSLPTPASIPMETKQDIPDQQQSLNFTLFLQSAN